MITTHSSKCLVVAFPSVDSSQLTCYFLSEEILHKLLKISYLPQTTADYWATFYAVSFGRLESAEQSLDQTLSHPNDYCAALSCSLIETQSGCSAYETLKGVSNMATLSRPSGNSQPTNVVRSLSRSFDKKLPLIVEKILEKKCDVTPKSPIFSACCQRLLLITQTYLKDLTETSKFLETAVRVIKDNVEQVVKFELENTPKLAS